MYRVFLTSANHVKLQRFLDETCLEDCLGAVTRLVADAEERFGAPMLSVRVDLYTKARLTPTPLRITNICGKIKHSHSIQFHNPGVLPFVKKTKNAFGVFETVYSVHGNLHTAQNRQNTLFRGGRSSDKILLSVRHVFDPASIVYIHTHMIVANVRLSHPINVDCNYLDTVFRSDARWEYRFVAKTEDQTYIKSFKLSAISPAWQAELVGEALVDKDLAVMLNLGRSGSVNLFVSIGKETPLTPSVEHQYMPLLAALVDLVDRSS